MLKSQIKKQAGKNENMPEDAPDGRTLQYRLKVAGKKAEIKGFTFKMLRDIFAAMCLQAVGDVYSLAYIMVTGILVVCVTGMMIKNDGFLKGIK